MSVGAADAPLDRLEFRKPEIPTPGDGDDIPFEQTVGDVDELVRVIRRFLGLAAPRRRTGVLTVRQREVAALVAEASDGDATCIIAALPAIWLLAQPATARPAWPAFASLAVWPPLAAAVSFLGYYLAFPASGYFAQERSVGLNLSGNLLALATHLLALAVLLLPAATAIALARFVGTVSDARSTSASLTTTSSFTLGRKSTTYSAPR